MKIILTALALIVTSTSLLQNGIVIEAEKEDEIVSFEETEWLSFTPTPTPAPTKTPQNMAQIRAQVTTNRSVVEKATIISNRYPKSPLRGRISSFFYQGISERDSKLLFALAITETRLCSDRGTADQFNCFNYFCTRSNKGANNDCGFVGNKGNFEYANKRLGNLIVKQYFSKIKEVNEEEINRVMIGKYCVKGCDHFTSNLLSIYNEL